MIAFTAAPIQSFVTIFMYHLASDSPVHNRLEFSAISNEEFV